MLTRYRHNAAAAMIRFGVIMVMTMSAGGFAHAEAELHSFGEISDPYFGEALYHYYQRDYFGSLSQTLVALKSQRLEDNKTQARQLLGELYLAYGLHRQAEDVLKSITQNSKTQDIQDHAWLDLATANYQRGLYDDARNNLRHISGKLSGDAEEQYLAIQSSLLLTEQEYRDAANVLQDLRGKTDWGTYGEYNLGIALLNLGRFSKGVDALNRVGRRNYRTHEMKALKDKANLALGFLFLRAKDPAQSIAYLERVRLNDAHSNRALLGIGWANLMLKRYEDALVPLMELRERPAIDDAVLESYLAVPHTFARVQSYNQAVDYYDKAVAAYEQDVAQLNQSINRVENGKGIATLITTETIGEKDWLGNVPGWPHSVESRIFTKLVSDQWFRATVRNYRDLRDLLQRVSDWKGITDVYETMLMARRVSTPGAPIKLSRPNLPDTIRGELGLENGGATLTESARQNNREHVTRVQQVRQRTLELQPAIKQAIAEHEEYLDKLIVAQLKEERKRIEGYLGQTRFAMAQIYDRLMSQGAMAQ